MKDFLRKRSIKHLLSLENVVGIGYGLKEISGRLTDQPAIVVMVTEKIPESQLASHQVVPKIMDDIVTDVVKVGKVSARNCQLNNLQHITSHTVEIDGSRKSRWRPALGGVSLGHFKITAGTLGAVVYDQFSGNPLILSNNHVLANATNGKDSLAKIGDPILQPGVYDGGTTRKDTIGKLYRFVPLKDKGSNIVDAAVAKPLEQSLVTPYILGIGTIKGSTLPELGMEVKKSGRTTGFSQTRIRAIHAIIKVDYGGKILTFKDQIITEAFGEGGDSGSLVVDGQNLAVGLLFAGSTDFTILNPIEPVLELLKVRIK